MKNFFALLKHRILSINFTLSFVIIMLIVAMSGWFTALHYYRIATAVPLISNDVLAQQTLAQTTVSTDWETIIVKRGETLQKIFQHLHLGNKQLVAVMKLAEAKPLAKLKPGQKLQLLITTDGQLQQLIYITPKTSLAIIRSDNGFQINNHSANPATVVTPSITKNPLTQQITQNISNNASKATSSELSDGANYGYAIVQKSLYEAGIQAGLAHSQAIQLVTLFSQNANLARNIRRGDKLSVLYQHGTHYILLAQLTHRSKIYQIYRFTDPHGNTDYYTQDGLSLHPPIVRAPLNYSHISSRFSAHRWQPILHFFRPHYGIDYAAPYGTPIKAAGDGKIIFLGLDGGYGKAIKIRHLSPYETVYAHLSRFAKSLHDGSYVHQGEVIGYVGDSGLSTGAHLHFEIRVNNIPHNPLTVVLPVGMPIANQYRAKFFAQSKQLLAELDMHEQQTRLASR